MFTAARAAQAVQRSSSNVVSSALLICSPKTQVVRTSSQKTEKEFGMQKLRWDYIRAYQNPEKRIHEQTNEIVI